MELIEPSHFDAVVVTSGLAEVLIASALARAGKSVLVLDAAESYGASWSSLSGPDYVHSLINRHLQQQQQHKKPPGSSADAKPQDAADSSQADAPAAGHDTAAATGDSEQSVLRIELRPVQPFSNLCGNVAVYTHPEVEAVLDNKQLIIDLAPKVLYQDEALVQLLVSCQAHNYLEFKLVEGSYIYQAGHLSPVPASRADLFADKSLSLADKRSLGRFLTACMEAQQGFGRLKDCFDSRPLLDLLTSEGLSDTLQQVVLYGIAMADAPPQQQQQQHAAAAECGQASTAETATRSVAQCPDRRSSVSSTSITAAQGLAALRLYTLSLGRYGGRGAFMAPCYGCGSIPEAFVRLAAVKGAITALRHGAQELQLLQHHQQPQPGEQQQSSTDSASEVATAEAADLQQSAAATGARVQITLTSGQHITANTVVGCREALKQPTGHVAELRDSRSCSRNEGQLIAHAVVLLDGSLVDGDNSLLLVIPPGSFGSQQQVVIRGVQFGPALQVTPAGKYLLYLSAVMPASSSNGSNGGNLDSTSSSSSRSSSVDSACDAQQLLAPAVDALAVTKGLEMLNLGTAEEGSAVEGVPDQQQQHVQSSVGCQEAPGNRCLAQQQQQYSEQQDQQQQQTMSLKPQALALCYFTTWQAGWGFSVTQQQDRQQQEQQDPAEGQRAQQQASCPVMWCPSAFPGHTGYDAVIKATEAAFRQQFPGTPWLTDDVQPSTRKAVDTATAEASTNAGDSQAADNPPPAAASSAASPPPGGPSGDMDEDDDAIDELTAALAELAASAGTAE